jgi:hypothetical protein
MDPRLLLRLGSLLFLNSGSFLARCAKIPVLTRFDPVSFAIPRNCLRSMTEIQASLASCPGLWHGIGIA